MSARSRRNLDLNILTPARPNPSPTVDYRTAWIAAMPTLFVFLWSTGFIGAKYGLPYAEPLTFLALRCTIVAVLMTAVGLLTRAPWPASRAGLGHVAVAGLLVQAGYLGGVFTAIHQGLPAGTTALVVGLQPVLTAILAGPLLGERMNRWQWLGIGLGFLGVLFVLSDKILVPHGNLAAVWLAIIGLFGITFGTLYQKKILRFHGFT